MNTTVPVKNVIRSVDRANNLETPLHILSICKNNEKYISLLSSTQHQFYILPQHPWNNIIEKRPANVHTYNVFSPPLDFIICYDRAEQYDEAVLLSRQLQVSIIIVDMCSKESIRPHHFLEDMHNIDLNRLNRHAALAVYNHTDIQQSWSHNNLTVAQTIVIGVDVNKFNSINPKNKKGIALDNNIPAQIGAVVASYVNNTHDILPTDRDDTNTPIVNTTKYFINPYKHITVKTLEAMAAENVVIALNTPDIASIITHQKTGWLLHSLDDLPAALVLLEQNQNLQQTIAQNARQKIVKDHSLDKFISRWQNTLQAIRMTIYHPIPTL